MQPAERSLSGLDNQAESDAKIRTLLKSNDFEVLYAMASGQPGGVTKIVTSAYYEYRIEGEEVVLNDHAIAQLSRQAGPLEEIVFPGFELEKSLKFSEAVSAVLNRFFKRHGIAPRVDHTNL